MHRDYRCVLNQLCTYKMVYRNGAPLRNGAPPREQSWVVAGDYSSGRSKTETTFLSMTSIIGEFLSTKSKPGRYVCTYNSNNSSSSRTDRNACCMACLVYIYEYVLTFVAAFGVVDGLLRRGLERAEPKERQPHHHLRARGSPHLTTPKSARRSLGSKQSVNTTHSLLSHLLIE